jgi:hypothetical protein
MSDIAKKTYEENKNDILGGMLNIEELLAAYEIQANDAAVFFLILDPDNPHYEERLTCLETNHSMTSAGYIDCHAGFIEGKGEVARVGIFETAFSGQKVKEILGDVLFDIYQLK